MDSVLPSSLWERFSAHCSRSLGVSLAVVDEQGRSLRDDAGSARLCSVAGNGDREKCTAFYRRATQQVIGGAEAVLFRCPRGYLVFGAPLAGGNGANADRMVLLGGPALPETGEAPPADAVFPEAPAGIPHLSPKKLLEFAHLAQFSLHLAVEGNHLRDSCSRRQAQVITLFEVASDLAQAASLHELYALALNTLGVLFDVECAAILLGDGPDGGLRVQSAMGVLEKPLLAWRVPGDPELWPTVGRNGGARIDEPHSIARLNLPEAVEQLVAFPLRRGTATDGYLLVINSRLDAEDEQLLRGFAVQLALAVDGRRLQTSVESRVQALQTVQEVGRRFVGCLEPGDLFRAILEESQRLTGAQKGSLMLPANGDGQLVVQAVSGMHERVVEKLKIRAGQGIAGHVFASGEALLVQDVEADPRFRRRNRPRYSTRSFLSVPIRVNGRTLGVVNLADKVTGELFSEQDIQLLGGIAAQATIAIERSTYYAQTQELRKISITDPLTHLLNRRYFQERLTEELDRATRHGHAISLIMADIDHFKDYNDANGHPAGDKALVLVGRALRSSVRTIDVVSRFGGEEFSVILPETRKLEAFEIGERIRREIHGLYFEGEEALPGGRLTISLGVAGFPEDARDLKGLISKADRALYLAKAQGRNRIVAYGSGERPPDAAPPPAEWTKVL